MADKLIMKENGWFAAPNWIFDVEHDLSPGEMITYLWYIRCASMSQAVAFPSYTTTGKKCNCCRTSAINYTEGLVQKGYIIKHTRHKGKKNETNVYEITVPEKVRLQLQDQIEKKRKRDLMELGIAEDVDGVVQNLDQGVVQILNQGGTKSEPQTQQHRQKYYSKQQIKQQKKDVDQIDPVANRCSPKEVKNIFQEQGISLSDKTLITLFQEMPRTKVEHIASELADRHRKGRVINPVGLLRQKPHEVMEAIQNGTFYPDIPEKMPQNGKENNIEIYMRPEGITGYVTVDGYPFTASRQR